MRQCEVWHPSDGFRVCDVCTVINKHANSVTKWLNRGFLEEAHDQDFARRLGQLGTSISDLS